VEECLEDRSRLGEPPGVVVHLECAARSLGDDLEEPLVELSVRRQRSQRFDNPRSRLLQSVDLEAPFGAAGLGASRVRPSPRRGPGSLNLIRWPPWRIS